MMKKRRLTALFLALILALAWAVYPSLAEIDLGALEQLTSDAVADARTRIAGDGGVLDAVEITDLSAPRAGAAFDTSATIAARAGVGVDGASWYTPVVWTDLSGNLVETARAGHTYMPFIPFFLPEGYEMRGASAEEDLSITLPRFLATATAKNGTLRFLHAPSSGLVFITGEVTVPAEGSTGASVSGRQGGHGDNARPTPRPTLEPELMVHTNQQTVDEYGADYLRYLIETVKNVVEPRAVNLLVESFPVYREAVKKGKLSSGIGFFVEKQDGVIACVKTASLVYKNSGNYAGKAMRMVVNADYFAVWDSDKGQYKFNDDRRSDLEFTITHEIFHATMYDFVTNGMLGLDENGEKVAENKFPTWFTEGTATAVDNAYSYRRNELLYLCIDLDRYEHDSTRAVSFTPERLIANYRRLSELYSINGNAAGAQYAYTSGYLASMYLMQLASEHTQGGDHVANRDQYESGDMREGMNYILEQLHDGSSLDQVIRDISPKNADGNPIYQGLSDYQSRFLNEADRNYSATFCATFLRYLESLSQDGRFSWGCILLDFDDMRNTLFPDGDSPVEPVAYQIEDTGDYVRSDVSTKNSLNTGGATLPGPGDGEDAADDDADTEPGDDEDEAAKRESDDEDTGKDGTDTSAEDTSSDVREEAQDGETPSDEEEDAQERETVTDPSDDPWADDDPSDALDDPWEEEPFDIEDNPWEEPSGLTDDPWEEPSDHADDPWAEESPDSTDDSWEDRDDFDLANGSFESDGASRHDDIDPYGEQDSDRDEEDLYGGEQLADEGDLLNEDAFYGDADPGDADAFYDDANDDDESRFYDDANDWNDSNDWNDGHDWNDSNDWDDAHTDAWEDDSSDYDDANSAGHSHDGSDDGDVDAPVSNDSAGAHDDVAPPSDGAADSPSGSDSPADGAD